MSEADKLVVSFKFPPDKDISGIVVAKRIINDNSMVDVLSNYSHEENENFEIINDFLNERLEVSVDAKRDSIDCIFEFVKQGMDIIDKRDYKEIYSRSWYMSNHYLALEYKFNHSDVIWTAEFSDPVLINIKGNIKNQKSAFLDNKEYIDKINSKIIMLNEKYNYNFKLVDNPSNSFYLAEYLTFIFSDKIIFTNENQRKVMLELYDDSIKELVYNKSEIIPHPTLSEKYYHLTNNSLCLNKEDINIAYFGNFYYFSRHFEALFYAFESLNHKFKNKIKFYLFISPNEFLEVLIRDLDFRNNIIFKKPINYFEFLNSTLDFDILLINDTITDENFSINPYLPSKFSDYLGSKSNVWILYEDKSTLSKMDVKYKSSMNNYSQSRDVLVNILDDYGFSDVEYSFNDNFFEKRITQLNNIIEYEVKLKNKCQKNVKKLEKENKNLKKENNKIKSSFTWRAISYLRRLFLIFKRK